MLYQRIQRTPGNHALSITANLSDSNAPYARMNLPLTKGAVEPMDARGFAGVEFEARGEGPYALRIQTTKSAFQATPAWSTVRIPFDAKLDLAQLTMLTFEIARPGGERAWLELHNLRFYKAETAALFEEEIPASRKYREESYTQFQRFAARLEREKPQEDRRRELAKSLGYPAPGFTGAGQPRMEMFGEDSVATYYRAWVPVAPDMDVYGLYLVPKNAKFPAPLVIAKHGGGGYPELAIFKGGGNYKDMIRGAAKEGYVVWAPITLMHPFRDRDNGTPIPLEVRRDMDAQFRKLGTSLMGVETMRISLSLDAMLRRPKSIPTRRHDRPLLRRLLHALHHGAGPAHQGRHRQLLLPRPRSDGQRDARRQATRRPAVRHDRPGSGFPHHPPRPATAKRRQRQRPAHRHGTPRRRRSQNPLRIQRPL